MKAARSPWRGAELRQNFYQSGERKKLTLIKAGRQEDPRSFDSDAATDQRLELWFS